MHKLPIYAVLVAAIFVFSFQTAVHSDNGDSAPWGTPGYEAPPQQAPKTPGEHVDDSYAELERIMSGDSTFGEYQDKNEELDGEIKKDLDQPGQTDVNSRNAQSAVGLIPNRNPRPASTDTH